MLFTFDNIYTELYVNNITKHHQNKGHLNADRDLFTVEINIVISKKVYYTNSYFRYKFQKWMYTT